MNPSLKQWCVNFIWARYCSIHKWIRNIHLTMLNKYPHIFLTSTQKRVAVKLLGKSRTATVKRYTKEELTTIYKRYARGL